MLYQTIQRDFLHRDAGGPVSDIGYFLSWENGILEKQLFYRSPTVIKLIRPNFILACVGLEK